MRRRHVSARDYLFTWLGLVALTLLTFALSFASLGPFALPVALVIALAKATLVALFFMHLVEQASTNVLAFVASATLFVILVALTVADPVTRRLTTPRPIGAGEVRDVTPPTAR